MRKKHQRKRGKHPDANKPINEETLAKLEAVKSKREATIAAVKLQLKNKFDERFAVTAANIADEEKSHVGISNENKSMNEIKMIQIRDEMKNVMMAGVEKVHAARVLQEKIKYDPKSATMTISGKKYKLKKNVHLVGWGCEALMLASTFEKIIVNHLKRGWLVVPRRTIARMSMYPDWFPLLNTRIILSEARSDDTPDNACVLAAKNIADYCKKLKKKDILVVLLAASGDDLLCLPKGTIGLREKMMLVKELRESGATNREIGVVRKALSAIRGNQRFILRSIKADSVGGGLARLAYPAKVISLVMSQTTGSNNLHLVNIVDGPTIQADVAALELFAQAILEKYGFHAHKLSYSIRETLKNSSSNTAGNAINRKMSDDNKLFASVSNCIAASPEDAIDQMAVTAFRLGYVPIKLPTADSCGTLSGEASIRQVSKEYTKILSLLVLAVENKLTRIEMYEMMKNSKIFNITETELLRIFPSKETWARGLYLLISPPPIVEKSTHHETIGKTGTNQELALCVSLDWYLKTEQYPILKEYVVWFLGGSSDGHDGNTEYAGAYGYGNLGVDVYRKFKTHFSLASKRKLEDEKCAAIHEAILPDRVLTSGNANFLFLNVNDGDELLKLGNASGYTHTNVGNLHIFRIARYQCSCDGSCDSSLPPL